MKKIIVLLLICMVLPVVTAAVYKQSVPVDIKVPCFNSTDGVCSSTASCNMTIKNPHGTIIINGSEMTNKMVSHLYFNITLNKTHTENNGEHEQIMYCCDNGECGYDVSTYMITPNGEKLDVAGAVFRIGLIVILITFLILLVFGFTKGSKVWVKALMFGLGWILLITLFYVMWVSSASFFTSNLFISRFFYWCFTITLYSSIPLFFGGCIWTIWLMITIPPMRRMINRGMPEDEAYARAMGKDLGKIRRSGRYSKQW